MFPINGDIKTGALLKKFCTTHAEVQVKSQELTQLKIRCNSSEFQDVLGLICYPFRYALALIRVKVDHLFRLIKRQFGYIKVRYPGG